MLISREYGTDIMFIVSPSNARSEYMPFYFLYLAGYLEKHGFRTEIVDSHEKSTDANFNIIMREIREKDPRYIGLAAFVTDYDVILDIAKAIKEHSDSKIIVGNAHPSLSPEDYLFEGSPFDVVVRGEGELTLKQFLLEYKVNSDNSHIKGIAYLEKGEIKITANRELMDLSECGMPAYHKLDMNWYAKPSKHLIRRLTTSCAVIYTGRGCPFNCGFCASNSVWQANDRTKENPVVRKRPVSDVIEELRILQDKYRFDFFYILDDTFGIQEKDILSFCTAYKKSGLKMLWGAETRVSCIKNEKIIKEMKEAGCIQLDYGVETGSAKLLKIVNKGITIEQTVRAFSLCRKNGIRTLANILINLPEETEEDLALTHDLLARIKPTWTSVGVTQPYPGTKFYKNYIKAGITKEDYKKLSRLEPPEEYRMAKHKIKLNKLLLAWQLKYQIYTPLETSMYKADERYWLKIIKSPRRWSYLLFILREMVVMPLQYVRYLYQYKMS
jgi:anaerobic magnesium-protoporphyrin IX monomethyl ester cyclase